MGSVLSASCLSVGDVGGVPLQLDSCQNVKKKSRRKEPCRHALSSLEEGLGKNETDRQETRVSTESKIFARIHLQILRNKGAHHPLRGFQRFPFAFLKQETRCVALMPTLLPLAVCLLCIQTGFQGRETRMVYCLRGILAAKELQLEGSEHGVGVKLGL